MRPKQFANLAECTEFRQTLLARPPRVVHGTVLLLSALLGAALLWAALTRANLVVRAPGLVRPVSTPMKIVNAGRSEVFSASSGGRVVEVNYQLGDEVRRGDVLMRLDTERLDNEIAKQKRTLQNAEGELAQLVRLEELSAQQFEATRAKLAAELNQAMENVRQARERQELDIRLAEVERNTARDNEARLRQVVSRGAVSQAEMVQAAAKAQEAAEKLNKSRLPVDEGNVEVLRRTQVQAEKEQASKRQEMELKKAEKRRELEAARVEVTNLELERKQAVFCAPIDGIVVKGEVKVGDVLKTGEVVLEIAEQRGFHFEAAVPSEEVANLRVGLPARIKLDAYDYQKYGPLAGTVCFISPDSGVAEGQRTAVYLVKIEVEGDEVGRGDLRGKVKLGMAGQAEIVTDQESLLALLVKKIRQTISLG